MSDEPLRADALRPGMTIWNPDPGQYPEEDPWITTVDVTGVTGLGDGRVAIATLQGAAPLNWAGDNSVSLFDQDDAALITYLMGMEPTRP